MTTIVTRAGKGSPLTHTEVDTNFTNLNTAKLEAGAIALGSAATPSISFTGDTNTGIYSPGADQVAISTGGSGRLFVDASGNVGIGGAPATNLDVFSTGTTTVRSYASAGNQAYLSAAGNAGSPGTSAFDMIQDGTSIAYLYQRANQPLLIGTNNTERLRITSAGFVGIGTSSPVHKIQINTASAAGAYGNAIAWAKHDDPTPYVGVSFDDTNDGLALAANTGSSSLNTTHVFIKRNTGRVGIGTTSPSGKLTVVGAVAGGTDYSNEQVSIFNSQTGVAGNQATLGFHLNNTNWGMATTFARVSAVLENGTTGATALAFGTVADGSLATSPERARIDSSGRLLVGTSTTSQDSTIVAQGSSGSASAILRLASSTAAPTDGEVLGRLFFTASNHSASASVLASRDGGTWTAGTSQPSRLTFSVTADGASSPTEAMRIKNSRILNFANTPVYADNAAAKTGGLVDGDVYRKSDGTLMIVYT